MKMKQGDQAKAVVLVIAILGVFGFALRPILFKGSAAPAATATSKAGEPETVVLSSSEENPDVTVMNMTPKPGSAPVAANPFRKTVDDTPRGAGVDSARWAETKVQGQRPAGNVAALPGLAPFEAQVPDDLEFRLDGVLLDEEGIAVVSRAGETDFLEVGEKAAYGYTITAISASGIRVSQKSKSKWVRIGERLDPPGRS